MGLDMILKLKNKLKAARSGTQFDHGSTTYFQLLDNSKDWIRRTQSEITFLKLKISLKSEKLLQTLT